MDKEVLERFVNQKIELLNDENLLLHGKIIAVYDDSIEFLTYGKIRILSFSRIKEIRPVEGNDDRRF